MPLITSVFLQTVSNELGYQGKAEMHEAVSLDLRKMLDEVDIASGGSEANPEASKKERLSKYGTALSQTLIGCKSLLPLHITHAFDLISTRFATSPAFRYLAGRDDTRWPKIYGIVHNELFTAISGSWMFPLYLPKDEFAVNAAMEKLTLDVWGPKDDIP
jgi:hypothetical protein